MEGFHADNYVDAAGYAGIAAESCQRSFDDLPFTEVWAVDFEFGSSRQNPEPVCLVAWELRSGRKLRLWGDGFGLPPYPTGPDVLFVAYYASAEIGSHLALGWPVPERVLDLFTEFRKHTNGIPPASGAACSARFPITVGRHWCRRERRNARPNLARRTMERRRAEAILDYCESDVEALARLLPAMLLQIDLPRALLRAVTWPQPRG